IHVAARIRHEVATVTDHDRVAGQPLPQFAEEPEGVDRPGICLKMLLIGYPAIEFLLTETLEPTRPAGTHLCCSAERREEVFVVSHDPACEVDVGRDLRMILAEVDHTRFAEAPISEPEVDRGPGHEDQISLPQSQRPCPYHRQLMV